MGCEVRSERSWIEVVDSRASVVVISEVRELNYERRLARATVFLAAELLFEVCGFLPAAGLWSDHVSECLVAIDRCVPLFLSFAPNTNFSELRK